MTGEGLASPPGSLELTGPPVSGRHHGGWSGGAGLFQEPRESETRSRSQLSPQLSAAAHSWQTAHSGHSQGGGVGGRTQQTRGNLSLGGSWQAGGASGRTGTGRVREQGRSPFSCLILQGLLNKNLQCYVSR